MGVTLHYSKTIGKFEKMGFALPYSGRFRSVIHPCQGYCADERMGGIVPDFLHRRLALSHDLARNYETHVRVPELHVVVFRANASSAVSYSVREFC